MIRSESEMILSSVLILEGEFGSSNWPKLFDKSFVPKYSDVFARFRSFQHFSLSPVFNVTMESTIAVSIRYVKCFNRNRLYLKARSQAKCNKIPSKKKSKQLTNVIQCITFVRSIRCPNKQHQYQSRSNKNNRIELKTFE